MKANLILASLVITSFLFQGCKEKKKPYIIVTQKPKVQKPKAPQKMGDYEQTQRINWLGNPYSVETKLTACDSLPQIDEGTTKYFDNIIKLRVVRADGTAFYNHTFSKKDFYTCLPDSYRKNGALLGIVFVKADGDYLYFAASVGSPDKTSDEYIPLVLKIHRLGSISISKDTQLDTADDVDVTTSEDDEDGV